MGVKVVDFFLTGCLRVCFIIFVLMCASVGVFAEEDGEVDVEGEVAEEGAGPVATPAIYIPLKPEFVVNFGGAGKLKYLKTNVTLRLADSSAASAVRHHMPFIRNNLVMLFTAQTQETLQSQDGRERMREAAIAEVRVLLEREDGLPPESVVDVLFNSLTWH